MESSKADVDHKTSDPHYVAQGDTNAFVGIDTLEEDIWLIALLTTIIIILVLLSCSLRSTTHYLQESYLITRAKEWVHFPLSREQQQQQQQQQSSLLSAETGVATDGPNNDAASSVGSQPDGDFCSWESETSQTGGGGAGSFEDAQEVPMKSSGSLDVDLCQRRGNALLLLNDGMTALSLAAGQSPLAAPTPPPIATVSSSTSSPQLTSKTSAQFFVFGSGASELTCQLPLTKSESLDENRRTNRESIGREKCFKANRSVDEILGSAHQGLGSSSSSSSASCTPKCRKLQERRGSNHSLTIAVKVTDSMAILPTVTTPRECSASQFLLTAGNTMTRRQLRTCLKDVNSIHAEFWSIPTNVPEAVEPDAGAFRKNRYRYVLPNPHSRVRLPLPPVDAAGIPVDDAAAPTGGYINANYIRDLNGEAKAYIATQGPLSNTIADFWLMVWSERSPAIVMITKLVESGKAKCESYLPPSSDSSARYGDINVSVESIEETAGCTVRHLLLQRDEEERVDRVSHYWYTDWPDHKTPDNPRTLVDLAATIESLRRGQSTLLLPSSSSSSSQNLSSSGLAVAGPIVVHCSAGVGRTGCFIALCHALSQLVTESRVDILGIVCALRCDRGGMVQTAEQYEFLHRAIILYEKSTLSDYDGGCD